MSEVKVTPLWGGREDGGVCSLLELAGNRVLLDCGCTLGSTRENVLAVAQRLAADGGVDCVLLSHADVHHMGALPILFGEGGLDPVPVFCTLPVQKFGQMLLYDMCLNIEMEGTVLDDSSSSGTGAAGVVGAVSKLFTLDDIDRSLSRVVTVRYSQNVNFPDGAGAFHAGQKQLHFCAYGAGRTIGGAVWRLRHGATEILYMMDINLKKEIVLAGTALDLLPTAPALIIVEGGCASRQGAVSTAARRELRAKGADTTGLVQLVADTLKIRGNALIPCDSGSRLLELLQILGKHWVDERRVHEHLIFLSPMSHNILEFARSQIEWTNDALSKQFIQLGRLNPFELPPLKVVHTLREMERLYPGPKVVLATDASLSCGLAKELLLRWGGNPLCRVILTDDTDQGSLARELAKQMRAPPIVMTVYRPQRVELQGTELVAHQAEQDRKRREREELLQRLRREEELALLTGGRDVDEEEEFVADAGAETADESGRGVGEGMDEQAPKRAKKSSIARFAQSLHPMFQNKDASMPGDEYGTSLDDLRLLRTEDTSSQRNGPRLAALAASAASAPGSVAQKAAALRGQQQQAAQDEAELQETPWKVVSSRLRVQFTCDFKEVLVDGRANLKAIKTVLQRVLPARVLVLRGSPEDCDAVAACAVASLPSVEAYAPASGTTCAFSVRADRVSLFLPPALLPKAIRELRRVAEVGSSSSAGQGQDMLCTVCAIGGVAQETSDSAGPDSVGVRTLRLLSAADGAKGGADSGGSMEVVDGNNVNAAAEEEEEGAGSALVSEASKALYLPQPAIGLVSLGEVSLSVLRMALERAGLFVEAQTAVSSGAVRAYLLVESQVVVHKENENDFVVEGPPVQAFFRCRQVIYKHFGVC